MTVTIDLTSKEQALLDSAAEREGVEAGELARKLVVDHLSTSVDYQADPLTDLFARWDEEDRQMSPEDIAEERRSWDELKSQMNAERARAGARPVF